MEGLVIFVVHIQMEEILYGRVRNPLFFNKNQQIILQLVGKANSTGLQQQELNIVNFFYKTPSFCENFNTFDLLIFKKMNKLSSQTNAEELHKLYVKFLQSLRQENPSLERSQAIGQLINCKSALQAHHTLNSFLTNQPSSPADNQRSPHSFYRKISGLQEPVIKPETLPLYPMNNQRSRTKTENPTNQPEVKAYFHFGTTSIEQKVDEAGIIGSILGIFQLNQKKIQRYEEAAQKSFQDFSHENKDIKRY